MTTQTLLVVGDEFARFAALNGAMTTSNFADMLDGRATDDALPQCIVLGQGVSESWLHYLQARASARGMEIEFINAKHVSERTGRRFAHKSRRKNILITDPVQTGVNQYQCQLAVDDDCEIMADHTTGCHLQGMLLIEAARQTFLAVTEWFLLDSDEAHYFVINRMDVGYRKFAFPVTTEIHFDITELDRSRADRLSVKADIRLAQAGECVCEVKVEYTAVHQARLEQREQQMAQNALDLALELALKTGGNRRDADDRTALA